MKKLILLSILFSALHTHSQPLDSIAVSLKHQSDSIQERCNEGINLNINGINRFIDTITLYYPLFPYDFIEFTEPDVFIKSQNLKILNEKKWYQSDQEFSNNSIRILFMHSPSYDSLQLYSFSVVNKDLIKLVKKEMPIYYPYTHKGKDSLEYSESIYNISKRKVERLFKYLNKLKHYDTFYNYGYPSVLSMEFIIDARYRLIISVSPDDKGWGDRYSRRITSKIIKWLSKH